MRTRRRRLARLPLIAACLAVGCSREPAHVRGPADVVADAARIDADSAKFTRTERSLPGVSSQGGTFVVLRADSQIVRAAAQFYGELGKKSETFYLSEGRPFLVVVANEFYDARMSGNVVAQQSDSFYYSTTDLIHVGRSSSPSLTPSAARMSLDSARTELATLLRIATTSGVPLR